MIVTFDQLKEATGYSRPGDVSRWCRDRGIVVFEGSPGGPWTTLDALNRALGIDPGSKPASRIRF